MPRLIDADALKNHYSWWEGGTKENTLDEQKKIFDTIVNLQPTIDPVKHGKWELVGSVSMCDPFGELAWGKMYRCSECGFVRRFIIDSEHYKFCPNCGAQMEVSDERTD